MSMRCLNDLVVLKVFEASGKIPQIIPAKADCTVNRLYVLKLYIVMDFDVMTDICR
jgi:hypothetical protein